jgi:NAD(P)H-flavin reductase
MKKELFQRAAKILDQIQDLEYQCKMNARTEVVPDIAEVSIVVLRCILKNGNHVDISLPGDSIPGAIFFANKYKALIENKIKELKKEFDDL